MDNYPYNIKNATKHGINVYVARRSDLILVLDQLEILNLKVRQLYTWHCPEVIKKPYVMIVVE